MIRYLMAITMLCGTSLGGAVYRGADIDDRQTVGGAKLQQAPKPLNLPLLDSVYRGMSIYYDSTTGPYFYAVPEPPRALDDIGFVRSRGGRASEPWSLPSTRWPRAAWWPRSASTTR